MKQFLKNIKFVLLVFLIISFALIGGLFYQQHRSTNELLSVSGESPSALRSRYQNAGSIYSKDGVKLAYSADGDRHYADDMELAKAVLHTVGDYTHHMENTVESRYQTVLLGTGRNIIKQFILDTQGKGMKGDDIWLTLDSRMCVRALELLGSFKGSAVCLNYQTGEVIAAVSTPTTDPENVINYEDIPDTALFNRTLQGAYLPGSTFKVLTSAAWLDSPSYDPELKVVCGGEEALVPGGTKEMPGVNHGENDLYSGFYHSCNHFFGTLGLKVGSEALIKTAENFGYNKEISLEKLSVANSEISFPTEEDGLLTWLSIGQPLADIKLSTSPLQLAMAAGSVANNGLMMKPKIVSYISDTSGAKYDEIHGEDFIQSVSSETARKLKDIMENAVNVYYDSLRFSEAKVGAKTGTTENTGGKYNRLLVAFIDEPEYPYAFSVVLEDTEEGIYEAMSGLIEAALEYKP